MIVYTDLISGAEIGSDAIRQQAPFDNEDFLDVAFAQQTTMVAEEEEINTGVACNVDEDAEAGATVAADGTEAVASKIENIRKSHPLAYPTTVKAKHLGKYMLQYRDKILMPVYEKEGLEGEALEAKKKTLGAFMKTVCQNIKNVEICFSEQGYFPTEKDLEGELKEEELFHPIVIYYPEGAEAPQFMYFKAGLKSERY